jgi:hypothetical protein
MEFLIEKYEIDYVMLEYPNVPEQLAGQELPDNLERVPFEGGGIELYVVLRP